MSDGNEEEVLERIRPAQRIRGSSGGSGVISIMSTGDTSRRLLFGFPRQRRFTFFRFHFLNVRREIMDRRKVLVMRRILERIVIPCALVCRRVSAKDAERSPAACALVMNAERTPFVSRLFSVDQLIADHFYMLL